MLSKKIKELKLRQLFLKNEFLKKKYNFLLMSLSCGIQKNIKKKYVLYNILKTRAQIKKISKVQLNNRCVLTNRSRGIVRPFFVSRIKMREYMQFGVIPGYKKAVW